MMKSKPRRGMRSMPSAEPVDSDALAKPNQTAPAASFGRQLMRPWYGKDLP